VRHKVDQDGQPEREQIFEELLRHHRGQISALVRRVVRLNEVKDVEQEVFLAQWGSVPKAPQETSARSGWIHELVRRVSFAWVRKEIKGLSGKPSPVGGGALYGFNPSLFTERQQPSRSRRLPSSLSTHKSG